MYSGGKLTDFVDLKPVYLTPKESLTIAVYKFQDHFYAYLDRCPHQGGPACEGMVVRESRICPSAEEHNIVCPWHGIAFDIKTGICRANNIDRLKSYDVVVEDDEVKLKL